MNMNININLNMNINMNININIKSMIMFTGFTKVTPAQFINAVSVLFLLY